MANELHAETTTGLMVYCVLLNSTGQVWDGAAWGAINGANWLTYDIAMAEAAAGIYLANMPAVVAGAYSYVVYSIAGLILPAVTDPIRGTGYIVWSGTAEVTGGLDDVVYGTKTHRQYLKLIAAVLAGKTSGGGTATFTIRDIEDAVNVVVATLDTDGNRDAVTISV